MSEQREIYPIKHKLTFAAEKENVYCTVLLGL